MPPFPSNALPSEFQEEHGSLDLDGQDDTKPTVTPIDHDVDDEDLDIANANQRVWLCKVRPRMSRDEEWSCGDEGLSGTGTLTGSDWNYSFRSL